MTCWYVCAQKKYNNFLWPKRTNTRENVDTWHILICFRFTCCAICFTGFPFQGQHWLFHKKLPSSGVWRKMCIVHRGCHFTHISTLPSLAAGILSHMVSTVLSGVSEINLSPVNCAHTLSNATYLTEASCGTTSVVPAERGNLWNKLLS